MDIREIREKIKSLDPVAHKALIEALTKKIASMEGKTIGVKAGNGVSAEAFLDIFNKAVTVLNQKYLEGGSSYIEKYRPYLEKETEKAEEKLNKTWQLCNDGKLDTEDFRKNLIEWYKLNLRNIEIYRKEKK
jgi:hypothetical protein